MTAATRGVAYRGLPARTGKIMHCRRDRKGAEMANTPTTAMRIPPELVNAARARVGQDVTLSVLVRAGLAALAGHEVPEALSVAQMQFGPKPVKAGR
jgi:hypothetical protein